MLVKGLKVGGLAGRVLLLVPAWWYRVQGRFLNVILSGISQCPLGDVEANGLHLSGKEQRY